MLSEVYVQSRRRPGERHPRAVTQRWDEGTGGNMNETIPSRLATADKAPAKREPRRATAWNREPAGLVGLYAARATDRCADLRPLINARRIALDGPTNWLATRHPSPPSRPMVLQPVGRGTAAHRDAVRKSRPSPTPAPVSVRAPRPVTNVRPAVRRKIAVAGLAAILTIAGVAGSGLAQEAPTARQYRYVVQPGDSLDSVAVKFGVDPEAILAASSVASPPDLSSSEIIVIPAPGQTPSDAAAMAAEREGSSPWVSDVYVIESGDTLADVAASFGLDATALAEFNSLVDLDALNVGERVLIPPTRDAAGDSGSSSSPRTSATVDQGEPAIAFDDASPTEPELIPLATEAEQTAIGSFISGVPTYVQQRNLSCEYAAAYIASSAFGAGVPEEAFIANIPSAANPHLGYRGNIDGAWGNTADYGVYPEALAPTLNANGYGVDVFYSYGDPAALKTRLDQGLPVAVWLGYWGDTSFVEVGDDGVSYKLAAGYHVVVAYGYDESGVYVSDPARGEYRSFSWEDFSWMWSVLDGMSMAVYPL